MELLVRVNSWNKKVCDNFGGYLMPAMRKNIMLVPLLSLLGSAVMAMHQLSLGEMCYLTLLFDIVGFHHMYKR